MMAMFWIHPSMTYTCSDAESLTGTMELHKSWTKTKILVDDQCTFTAKLCFSFFRSAFLFFFSPPRSAFLVFYFFLLFSFSAFHLFSLSAFHFFSFSSFLLCCFSAFHLFCFTASLLLCFSPFLLFRVSSQLLKSATYLLSGPLFTLLRKLNGGRKN